VALDFLHLQHEHALPSGHLRAGNDTLRCELLRDRAHGTALFFRGGLVTERPVQIRHMRTTSPSLRYFSF